MKKLLYTFTFALIISPCLTKGQLGAIKNKLQKNKDTQTSPAPENNAGKVENTSSSPAPAPAAETQAAAPKAKIDFKQHPFPPTILMSSLLEQGFSIHSDQPTPFFFLPKLVFLPTKDESGNEVNYENKDYIYGVIRQGDKVLYKEYLEPLGTSIPVVTLKGSDRFQTERPSNGLESSSYTCEIILDGRTIFTMPFEIIDVKNDDIYARDKEFRLMDGYWSKYGYLASTSDGLLTWNTFEANMAKKFVEPGSSQSKQCKVEQQLFYNGQPISKLDEASYSVRRGEWTLESTTLVDISSTKTTNYLRKDGLKDGNYVLKMKMNDEQREYAFSVKGGKPVYIDEQDRTKTTDLSKAFEGMNTEYWVRRTK